MFKFMLLVLICSKVFAFNLGEEAKFLHAKVNDSNKQDYEIITITIEEYDSVLQAYKLKQVTKSSKPLSIAKTNYNWVQEAKLNLNNWVNTENCIKARSVHSSYLVLKNNGYQKIEDSACLFDINEVKNFGLYNPFMAGNLIKKVYFHNEHQENFLNIMRVDGELDSYIFLKNTN